MSDLPAPPVPRPGVRVLGTAFVLLFVLICLAALAGYFGYHTRPSHWTQQRERIERMAPAERAAVSEALMNRLLDEWSAGPADATRLDKLIGQRTAMRIAYEELNVWLAEEGIGLLSYLDLRLPKAVKGAMVDSPGGGLLRLSCDIETKSFAQVVTLTFNIAVADDGTVTSELVRASAGRLPLPTQTAIDLVAERTEGREQSGRLLALMRGTPTGPIDLPIDPSEDGLRDGRLVGLEVGEDAMVITRETVRRGKTQDR